MSEHEHSGTEELVGTAIREQERPTRQFTFTGTGTGDVAFDHEKLVVFQVTRELVVLTNTFLPRKMPRDLHDQLDRSVSSIMYNIGEGAGKTARAEKRRFYEIARGSATEAATQYDMLQIKDVITAAEYQRARALLIRIVQMLSKLCAAPRST